MTFTVLDDGRATAVEATVEGERVRISPAGLTSALGWELKPEGLCRGPVCVPLRKSPELVAADGVDLAAFAQAVGRPLALDPSERVAYVGVAAGDRARELASLEAPDFALPDLTGRLHRLSDYRGRKVLLIAYASW